LNTRCCGRKFSEKSDAYVSTAREVLQLKFIDDFICKALLAAQKNIAEVYTFTIKVAPLNIGVNVKSGACADSAFFIAK